MKTPDSVYASAVNRDIPWCVRCGVDTQATGGSRHHRIPRGMGGTSNPAVHTVANIILLCGTGTTKCHGWVHAHPLEAKDNGWSVPSTANPEGWPVLYRLRWRLLSVDGGWRNLSENECQYWQRHRVPLLAWSRGHSGVPSAP